MKRGKRKFADFLLSFKANMPLALIEAKDNKAHVAASLRDASSFPRVESPQAWRVSIEQIQANGYNLDVKNPHDSSEAPADPDELLADYQIQMAELQKTRDRLKDELMVALLGTSEPTL